MCLRKWSRMVCLSQDWPRDSISKLSILRPIPPRLHPHVREPCSFDDVLDAPPLLTGDSLVAVAPLRRPRAGGKCGGGNGALGRHHNVRIGKVIHRIVPRLQEDNLVSRFRSEVQRVALGCRKAPGGEHKTGGALGQLVQGQFCGLRVHEDRRLLRLPEEVLFPDGHNLIARPLRREAHGLDLDLGVFVLFEIEEEAPLSLMEEGPKGPEGLKGCLKTVGIASREHRMADQFLPGETLDPRGEAG